MKKRIWRWLLPVLIVVSVAFTAWVIWDNDRIVITQYAVENDKLPESFSGFRIAQISDFHNSHFGEDNIELLQAIKAGNPDIIAITGDLVDRYHPDIDNSMAFVEEAVKIAPVYYVSGNHEFRLDYDEIRRRLIALGVTIVEGQCVSLFRGEDAISISGVQDIAFSLDPLTDVEELVMQELLSQIDYPEGFCILLSHRNNMMEPYADAKVDLVLSGHAHGGQFRLPWLGGVFAGGQLFPEYDGGMYTQEDTTLIVSRGLGNSIFPFRVNNPPELVFITLY